MVDLKLTIFPSFSCGYKTFYKSKRENADPAIIKDILRTAPLSSLPKAPLSGIKRARKQVELKLQQYEQ